ncbi:hypothetical protein [Diaphorobacter sp.]|uniref:hypothetical protein n=1 Tax=Diaphorobacter sp. TaxID=1934310 RepID=UPI003D14DA11
MRVWAFDENRADFVEASTERMSADPTGCYIIRRGDDVLVCEHGQERPMPERLTVAGVPFDREQFEDTLPLRAEMEQDGQWARAQLQARDRSEVSLPLELPIWVTKTPLSIEDMNEIAAAGWAGKLGDSEGKA